MLGACLIYRCVSDVLIRNLLHYLVGQPLLSSLFAHSSSTIGANSGRRCCRFARIFLIFWRFLLFSSCICFAVGFDCMSWAASEMSRALHIVCGHPLLRLARSK